MILLQLGNEVLHGGEVHTDAGLARLDRQGYGQMGLAHPGRAQEDDVLLPLDEGQIKQRHDVASVECRLEGEVELIDGLDKGEPRDLERCLNPALLLAGDLFLEQVVQEGEIAFRLLLADPDRIGEDLSHAGESQPGQVRFYAFEYEGIAHAHTSA